MSRRMVIPDDEMIMLEHYVLSAEDIAHINQRRGDHNRLGFALQLCVFRYPGRFIQSGELLPHQFIRFVSAQLGIKPDEAEIYAERTTLRDSISSTPASLYPSRGKRGRFLWVHSASASY